jgi:hypothetical protein
VYAEQLMANAGYNDNDPRQKLIALKWLLRSAHPGIGLGQNVFSQLDTHRQNKLLPMSSE